MVGFTEITPIVCIVYDTVKPGVCIPRSPGVVLDFCRRYLCL